MSEGKNVKKEYSGPFGFHRPQDGYLYCDNL